MKPIIYVAAPVSGDPVANAWRAIRWVKWFVLKDPSRVYIAPWVAEVLGFGEEKMTPAFYQRVLDDDMAVVRRMNGLTGVGGKWSGGMLQERAVPLAFDRPILDLTMYLEPEELPDNFDLAQAWASATNANIPGYTEPY